MKPLRCALNPDWVTLYWPPYQVNGVGFRHIMWSLFERAVGWSAVPWPGLCCSLITLITSSRWKVIANFNCGICIWNLLLSTLNIQWKELLLAVKQAMSGLKNPTKPSERWKHHYCISGQTNCWVHSQIERKHWWAQEHRTTKENNCGWWQKNSSVVSL